MESTISNDLTTNETVKLRGGFLSKIFKGDKIIWSVFIALCIISLIEVFSATSTLVYQQQNHWGPILRHATFLLFGVGVILFIHNIPYRFFSSLVVLLGVSVVLVILTWFIGKTTNDSERWLYIMGISFQPSEFAKISLMGTIAFLLSKQNSRNEKSVFKWMIGLIAGVCIIIARDNLSTAALLFAVCYILMFIGNVRPKFLFQVVLGVIFAVLLFIVIDEKAPDSWMEKMNIRRSETWSKRIERFITSSEIDEDNYYQITDDNYQVAHSKIAIANGGVFGRFPGNSKERDFLPQAYSDFIYSIILEEMGLLGGTGVLILYIIILMRAGKIARKTEKLFPKYLILGSALMLGMQAFVNMAVAVGLFPVTGQPLPLISRGGTSTLVTCAYFGIILSADRFGVRKKEEIVNTDIEVINLDTMNEDIINKDEANTVLDESLNEEYAPEIEF